MNVKLYSFISLLLVSVICLSARASVRCSGGVVSVGDGYGDVEKKCGTPDYKRVFQVGSDASPNPRFRSAVVVLWYYGPRNGAVTQIRFTSDKVSNMKVYRPMGSGNDGVYLQNP
ncbi:DUF2845 domain-containing protein [Metapseudomonas furukawaii]|uniref:DUF2845 domain-containing protein n=1 Tax=Metapseudomonas furukawaii TaxID=1149133 RepID=UPI0040454583